MAYTREDTWFAWRPVKLIAGWRWLRKVRRITAFYSDGAKAYRYYMD